MIHGEDDLEHLDSDDTPTPVDWSEVQGEKRKRRKSEEESYSGHSSDSTKRRQEM